MGECLSPFENIFKFKRIRRNDFRWGHPLYLARPCCDSGKRARVAIASASFWLDGVALWSASFFQSSAHRPLHQKEHRYVKQIKPDH